MQVELRKYKKQDYGVLKEIIRKTWQYDRFCDPKTAAKLADVFLSSCLTNETFSRVAVVDGKMEGIILANHKAVHKCPLGRRLHQIRALASLYLSRGGRKAARIFGSVHGIDQELLKECGGTYPAELALFAVSDSCRGMGVGTRLFQAAMEYLSGEKVKKFYLFTDTSCNYGFYEHQGMVRRCEKNHTFQVAGETSKMTFFIYDQICQ